MNSVEQFPVLPFSNKRKEADNLAEVLQEEGSLCTQNAWSDHPMGGILSVFRAAVQPPTPPENWMIAHMTILKS